MAFACCKSSFNFEGTPPILLLVFCVHRMIDLFLENWVKILFLLNDTIIECFLYYEGTDS